ncbi:hypothetical protein [Pannonibacter phragmitetus]|uniref:hypothetical protein n=1 Tax=Pannonibacter phragmitetus TaxID=121719 RepID=UPI000F014FDB|nr:hypothetical protein [Pannonibacter phragmitetus]
MNAPDSLLSAARKLADAIGRPWSAVQPYYKALQEPDLDQRTAWLPKSLGRSIWYAHPNYITRLLIALGGTTNPAEAHATLHWAQELTPGGRERYMTERPAADIPLLIELEFSKYLVDAEAASKLLSIEIHPDRKAIVFNQRDGKPTIFCLPGGADEIEGGAALPFIGIQYRGVIDGRVLVTLANTVKWRRPSQPPYGSSREVDVFEGE